MQIVQTGQPNRRRVAVLTAPASGWDVTDQLPDGTGLAGAIGAARAAGTTLSEWLTAVATRSDCAVTVDWATSTWIDASGSSPLAAPISAPEVWAAGVTYKTSREARLEETDHRASFYADVYDAERPELFLKDNAERRTVGPGAPIGIRGDSALSVPEPEFALVLDSDANIVGITLGNDVTARDIESENPLYLPQAKIFAGSCAIGPAVTILDDALSTNDYFDLVLTISRDGAEVFRGETNTDQLNRRFTDLARHVARYNVLVDGTVLLTGTGVIPPMDFALQEGDVVQIASAQLGLLKNPVTLVDEFPLRVGGHAGDDRANAPTPRWARLVQLAEQEGAVELAHPTTHQQYMEDGAWVRLPIDTTSGWTEDGSYDHGNWMAGFAPGVQWIAHLNRRAAADVSAELSQALREVARRKNDTTTHDLGFLFYPAFALGQQLGYLTVDEAAPGVEAAYTLARRFRPGGGYIQAFGELDEPRAQATSTIDTMMNLPLLWWASEVTGDVELAKLAYCHAQKSKALFREDFSTYHLATYDPTTGEVLDRGTFQGADNESCWTRGQAWAIAGYAWAYAVTGDAAFGRTARRAWEFFEKRIPADGVVPWDFSDTESGIDDASASAIAALGALILADTLDDVNSAAALRKRADDVLDLLFANAVRTDPGGEGILLRSCYSKPHGKGLDGALPYGDFYFLLAVALADGVVSLGQFTPHIPAQDLHGGAGADVGSAHD